MGNFHNELKLFFICINNISDDLSTISKLFAYDTSLFFIARDVNTSVTYLNKICEK